MEFPRMLVWIAFSFSRGSARPRDRTWVSCITGWFFIIWATREAQKLGFKSSLTCVVSSHPLVTPWKFLDEHRKEKTWRDLIEPLVCHVLEVAYCVILLLKMRYCGLQKLRLSLNDFLEVKELIRDIKIKAGLWSPRNTTSVHDDLLLYVPSFILCRMLVKVSD